MDFPHSNHGLDSSSGPDQLAKAISPPSIPSLSNELCEAIYDELRRVAAWHLMSIAEEVTLSPTDLAHEAIARILQQRSSSWESENHLLAITSMMSRRVLMNHLHHRNAQKRRGKRTNIQVDFLSSPAPVIPQIDLFAMDDALNKLYLIDQRQATIVELKIFGGLSSQLIADYLTISTRTVQVSWNHARLWLSRELSYE